MCGKNDELSCICVLGTGEMQGLLDARFDIAFGLPTDGGQLGDDKISCSLHHSLFAE
jgi:hypothetical protein